MDKINDFEYLVSLWKNYNNASLLLTKAMSGTGNEVGEFSEQLVCKYYNAKQLNASQKSADLITEDGKLIQVKSRKIEQLMATTLNVIRSWDFNILVIVLFSKEGNILKAIEIDSIIAKEFAKPNKHQNGYILTTTKELLENRKSKDITKYLQNILDGKNIYNIDVKENIKILEQNKIPLFNNNVKFIENEDIIIKNIIIKKYNNKNEKLQDYIKRVLHLLFKYNFLSEAEINRLQDLDYCKETFFLYFPLLEKDSKKIYDDNGYQRYWKKEYFGNKYYGCKEWWKDNEEIYFTKFMLWLKYISDINNGKKNGTAHNEAVEFINFDRG